MAKKRIPHSVGVHDGPFHADEVTACALLWTFGLIDPDRIIRTRKTGRLAEREFVCDVGGIYDPSRKLFDHHQVEYQGPLSSAGMVLQYLRDEQYIDEELYNLFDESMVKGVDAHDNGFIEHVPGTCTFSHIIANMVPISYSASPEEYEAAFRLALNFTHSHLERMCARYKYIIASRDQVATCMEGATDVLIFDENIPWMDNFFALGGKTHSAIFVIMPSGSHWKLRGIPPSMDDRMAVRVPLPEEWAGMLEEELTSVSGISGAIFCHKGRFISVWRTKENALAALDYTLKKVGRANNL